MSSSDTSEPVKAGQSSKISEQHLECFLQKYCGGKISKFAKDTCNQILPFKETFFEKCHQSLHVRKNLKLKYNDIRLTTRISPSVGYHTKCYKDFTALKVEQRAKSENKKPYREVESRAYSPSRPESSPPASDSEPSSPDTSMNDVNEDIQSKDSAEYESFNQPSKKFKNDDNLPEPTPQPAEYNDSLSESNVEEERNEESNDNENKVDNESQRDKKKVTVPDCLLCEKPYKTHKGTILKTARSFSESVKNKMKTCAEAGKMERVVKFLNNIDNDEPIYFHKLCQIRLYKQKTLAYKPKEKSDWHLVREAHKRIFDEIVSLVTEHVVEKKKFFLLQYLVHQYRAGMEKEYAAIYDDFDVKVFRSQELQSKLIDHFKNDIHIIEVDNKKVVASSDVNEIPQEQFLELLEDKKTWGRRKTHRKSEKSASIKKSEEEEDEEVETSQNSSLSTRENTYYEK